MADNSFEGDDDNAAVQEMMGFSSFGMQKPAKVPQPLQSNKSSATGSNTAPVAKRKKTTNQSKSDIPEPTMASHYARTNLVPASLPPNPRAPTFRPSEVSPKVAPTNAQISTLNENQSQEIEIPEPDPDTEYDPKSPTAEHSTPPVHEHQYPQQKPSKPTDHTVDPNPDDQVQATRTASYYESKYPLLVISTSPPPHLPPRPQPHPNSTTSEPPAYTNPDTGISFTRSELNQLARGEKFNERGDRIYFKPSFVEDDPWRWAREAKERRLVTEHKVKDDGGTCEDTIEEIGSE